MRNWHCFAEKLKRFSALTLATLKNTSKTVVPCNADGVQTVISQCPGFTSIHESRDSKFLSDVQQPFHLSIYQAQIKYYWTVHKTFCKYPINLWCQYYNKRYFTSLTRGIWLLINIIWQHGFWPPKVITWLLRELNFISHFVPYTLQILTSCCRPWPAADNNTMSSAYRTQPINREPICTPWPDSFSFDITPSM